MGVGQLTVMFLWGRLAFGLDLFHTSGFVVMTVFTAAAAAGFGLVLATAAQTRAQLSGMSTIIILIMSSLGGSMFPRFLMSETMQKIGLVTFNAWALDGYLKVFWRNAPLLALWPQLLVLAGLTLAFLLGRAHARAALGGRVRRGQRVRLYSVVRQLDAESFRHAVERPPIDSEHFRGPRPIATDLLDHVEQIAPLDLVERRQIDEQALLQIRLAGGAEGQIVDIDRRAAAEHDQPLDRVLQLANVARPSIRGQRRRPPRASDRRGVRRGCTRCAGTSRSAAECPPGDRAAPAPG